jgi:hypothetical protein
MQARHEDHGAPADLRRAVPLAAAGRMPDDVQRMQEFLGRHPHVSWLRPGTAGVMDQTATWIETSADPRVDGTPVTVSRFWLGQLVDYLEARFSGAP